MIKESLFIVNKNSRAVQNRNTSETDLLESLKSLVYVARRILGEENQAMHMKTMPMKMLKELSNDFM